MNTKKSKFRTIKKILKWSFGILAVFIIFILFSFNKLLTFLVDAPSLTGFPFNSTNYLIVAQNEAELRPTGGFISAFALVQFDSGKLKNLELHDVYGAIDDHEYIDPPYPLGELLANEHYTGHSFRDANIYADFPSSAEELIKYFNITNPETQIDGVVAINFSLFGDVLAEIGDIEVDGLTLNDKNLFEQLEHKINNVDRHNIDQIYSRKQFLQPIFYATIKKALIDLFQWKSLSEVAFNALNNKNVQLYFKDEDLQDKYTEKGWTGVWQTADNSDFFAVVESNLGGMKSNRYISRDVTYDIYFKDGAPVEGTDHSYDLLAKVAVKISHHGSDNIPISGDYASFVRVYTPYGSELLEKTADYVEYQENGRSVFAQKITLKPGESTTLYFDYLLPRSVLNQNKYNLYVPRQSSTNDLYSVTIHAPRGCGVNSDQFETKENVANFRGVLEKDMKFQAKLLPDKLSPLVVFQKMTSPNSATIHFNEDIQILPDDGTPATSVIEMIDMDFINNQTDEIVVDDVRVDKANPRVLNFKFQGLTKAPEERYKVKIRWISDIYGNIIDPNPTEITLIQRNL